MLSYKIEEYGGIDDKVLPDIASVMSSAFGEWDSKWFFSIYKNHLKFHLAIARVDSEAIGFKLGYEKDSTKFYSWLGGVSPKYRGLGVAKSLMQAQHLWCQKQGYKSIQTQSLNKFKEMLILNLKNGFQIIGTHYSKQDLKIVFEKNICD
jgi:ribosomal protein S18 acetylase RimI-like enzyme